VGSAGAVSATAFAESPAQAQSTLSLNALQTDWQASQGLVGQSEHAHTRFLHATDSIANYHYSIRASGQNSIKNEAMVSQQPLHLLDANAKLLTWQWSLEGAAWRLQAHFQGHVPIKIRLQAPEPAQAAACQFDGTSASRELRAQRQGALWLIEGNASARTQFVFRCTR
jgi:hypothetical protein